MYGKQQLFNALETYDAEYLVDLIIAFLPSYKLQKYTHKDSSCIAYFHEQTLSYYADRMPPCREWKHFGTKQNAPHCRRGTAIWKYAPLQVSLFGAPKTGKSSLCYKFLTGRFKKNLRVMKEHRICKQMDVNGCSLEFVLNDHMIQDFGPLSDRWIRESVIILVCFAINNLQSFEDALKWRERVLALKQEEHLSDNFAMILVATKCDLKYDAEYVQAHRNEFVDEALILDAVKKYNMPYIECSAKDGGNVHTMFEYAVYEYWMQSTTGCCLNQLSYAKHYELA